MLRSLGWLKWALIFVLFVLCVFAFKMGESIFWSENGRRPASDSKGFDLSGYEGPQFQLLARLRLSEGIEVQMIGTDVRLRAGHFLGPTAPVSVCSTYPYVEYEFGSSDQAISGEPVLMKIITECESDASGKYLEPVEFSVEKLKSEKFRSGEFQIHTRRPVTVRLSNTGDSWPSRWSLRGMRLYNSLSEIRVEGEEVYRLRNRAVEMNWE